MQPERREEDVAAALDHLAPAAEVRLLDVQQRRAHQRADVHPRAGDLDESGIDQHLDTGALQGPGQLAQVVVAGGVVAGDGDGVAVHGLDDLAHFGEVAEDGHAQVDDRADLVRGQARADDLHAAVGLGREPLVQLTGRCGGADDDDVADAQAFALAVMQGLASGEAGGGAEQHRERDADDDEGEQGLLTEETGRERAGDDDADTGPQDRTQLVGSDTDAVLDVAAGEADGQTATRRHRSRRAWR